MELDLNHFYIVTRRHAFKFPTFMILYGTLGLGPWSKQDKKMVAVS